MARAPLPLSPPPASLGQPVRARGLLRRLEWGFHWIDRTLERLVPEALNPFHHTGAVAVTTLFVATLTGIVLLIWYKPSVHLAYESVAAMSSAPFTAGLIRSLHRYSSDACVFFVLVHALRTLFEGRFAGARWLAWVTGVATVGTLWLIGWTGYWLVWDERGQHVAVGTALVLDQLPIVVDPMGRSFLFDEAVNSLLFFAVFFVHMLVPLALVFGLWLHVSRANRARWLTHAPLTIWTLGSLLLLSIAYPADSAAPAELLARGQTFSMDWWYLLPLVLTDRLDGGAVWSFALIGGVVLGSVPWWLARGRPKSAIVDVPRCNACKQCYEDCPFEAVTMVPRTDGSPRYELQSFVDPAKCVGCGICSGSCDSIAIDLDWFHVLAQREKIEGWLRKAGDEEPCIALACTESAGGRLTIDTDTGACPELPGYRVLEVPCAGWVHALTLERALRRGAQRALVVACAPGGCHYREGPEWLRERLDGEREPGLRTKLVERSRIDVLELDRTRLRELVRRALAFRRGDPDAPARPPSQLLVGLTSVALAVIMAAAIGVVSDLGYSAPAASASELVVTFKHPGRLSENCRDLSPEEQAKMPVHMRRDRICARERASVRLRVALDGAPILERAYAPAGIWKDLNSVAVETIRVAPGEHRITVDIGDSLDPDEWSFSAEQTLSFTEDARRVVAFDRLAGFTWH